MKQFKLKYLFIALAATVSFSSCSKDDDEDIRPETPDMLILNQGNIGKNNTTLSAYNFTTKNFAVDAFATVNGRGIGDTGNDLKQYGSKVYIIVNYSSTVEVVNAGTLKTVKQISFKDGSTPRQPRSVAFYQNKAYITSYDGTVAVLDTASLTVDKYITVGRNPEQLAVANGKLYVANSGGLDYPDVDNTVSVINLSTGAVVKTITVGDNPYGVAVDSDGDVYVSAYGVYLVSNASMTIINSTTDVVKSKKDFDGGGFTIGGNYAYYFYYDAVAKTNNIKVYDTKTETVVKESFITDGTAVKAGYALTVNAKTGEVYVGDAMDYNSAGKVTAFDKNGKKEFPPLVTGISPSNILLINK